MGKAKIVSHLGNSEYEVVYYYDMTIINNKLIKVDTDISATETTKTTTENDIEAKELEIKNSGTQLDGLITLYHLCVEANPTKLEECDTQKIAMQEKNVKYLVELSELGAMKVKLDNINITLERLKKEKIRLEAIDGTENMNIWCIDLCDREPDEPDYGLWLNHGEIIPVDSIVGTIDIFDFITKKYRIFIVPASYSADPAYDIEFHGIAGNALSNDGNGFVYNYNMRGPKEAWHPEFRLAIVNSIDDGLAQITYNNIKDLDGIHYNTEDHLHDSDIVSDYMICSADPPFKKGDQVIVTFTGDKMESPRIIGYSKNPKPCEGVIILHYNPIYGRYASGWGQLFYDTQEPPVEIDEPYGTAYGNYDVINNDDRNKIAEMTATDIEAKFGEQVTSFPGNTIWMGAWGAVSWWAMPATMCSQFAGWAHMQDTAAVVGDILIIPYIHGHDNTHVQFLLLEHNIDGTGTSPPLGEGGDEVLEAFENWFGMVDIFNIKKVWINGQEKAITHGTVGAGLVILGCGLTHHTVTGNWLIYVTAPLAQDGRIGVEEVHAINLATDDYHLLTTYDMTDFIPGDVDNNKGKIIFSENGMSFITRRMNGHGLTETDPGNWDIATMDLVRGTIGFDVLGIPNASVTMEELSTLNNWSEKNGQETMIGYSGDNEVIVKTYPLGFGNSGVRLESLFFDAQYGIFVGKTSNTSDDSYISLYVQVGGSLYSYAFNSSTRLFNISSNASVGIDISAIICDEVWDYPLISSIVGTKYGVFISLAAYDQFEPEKPGTIPNPENSNNVFIDNDGIVTDMSELLLLEPGGGPSVSPDPLLRMRPMSVSRKLTN